ncbi:MAG: NUDIX domain-containing protein [Phormidesmis sp.]
MSDHSISSQSAKKPLIEVTMAILYRENQFLMQLRDDLEHIIYPGVWGFFGGHNEDNENPTEAMKRELLEEIGYVPPKLDLFRIHEDDKMRRYFYYGALTVPISELALNEGQDLALCSVAEIKQGEKLSNRLGEMRAMGDLHQQALLSFIDSEFMP